jgi:hemerythrin superfamily protein
MNDRSAPDIPTSAIDALALIKRDHESVENLFRRYEELGPEAAPSERDPVVAQICTELAVHAAMEEQLFYPALRQANAHHRLLEEAHREHVEAKALVTEIQAAQHEGRDPDWKVGQLIRAVRHHVDEEEREIFPAALAGGVDLVALGTQMERRKGELNAEQVGRSPFAGGDLPPGTQAAF